MTNVRKHMVLDDLIQRVTEKGAFANVSNSPFFMSKGMSDRRAWYLKSPLKSLSRDAYFIIDGHKLLHTVRRRERTPGVSSGYMGDAVHNEFLCP